MYHPEDEMDSSESSDYGDMDASETMIHDDKYSSENTSDDDDMDCSDHDKIKMVRSYTEIMHPDLIAEIRREGRKSNAEDFRSQYTYGPGKEQKTCIWSGGGTYSWPGKSSGIIWVGVHGMDSTCVVTRTGYLDVARAHGSYEYRTKEQVLRFFRKTAISEMEDLEDPSSKLCKKFGQSFKKPFGVVSGIPCIDKVDTECGHEASSDEYESGDEYESEYESDDGMLKLLLEEVLSRQTHHQISPDYDETKTIGYLQSNPTSTVHETLEASSAECDEEKAVEFLKEKMSCDTTFTLDETIQTAISAFQHLFPKKFEANEIEVSVTYFDYRITSYEAKHQDKDPSIKELELSDIENRLAVINEPGSGGSSSGGSSSGGSSSGGSSSDGSSSGGSSSGGSSSGGSRSGGQAIIFVKESEMSDIGEEHLPVINEPGSGGPSTGSSSSD